MRYEYKIIPAPEKGDKARGTSGEARFAHAVERLLNDMAEDGWEYQRTDTLPSSERGLAHGLTGTETVWRNLLVFRRPHEADASVFQPKLLEGPKPSYGALRPEAAAPSDAPSMASLRQMMAPAAPSSFLPRFPALPRRRRRPEPKWDEIDMALRAAFTSTVDEPPVDAPAAS